MCCSPWGLKESDKTGLLKNDNKGPRSEHTHGVCVCPCLPEDVFPGSGRVM